MEHARGGVGAGVAGDGLVGAVTEGGEGCGLHRAATNDPGEGTAGGERNPRDRGTGRSGQAHREQGSHG